MGASSRPKHQKVKWSGFFALRVKMYPTRLTKPRNFSDKFRAAVALEALRGDKTVQEIATKRQLHPIQVTKRKRQAIWQWRTIFVTKAEAVGLSECRKMIRNEHTDLSAARQCELLKISRTSTYYKPVSFYQATIGLMYEIDQIFSKRPFFGSRWTAWLSQGVRQTVTSMSRLIHTIGLQSVYKQAGETGSVLLTRAVSWVCRKP